MVIRQGEIYWVELGEPTGSEPGYARPYVVIQNNVFNQSRMNTVLVCALTPNPKRGQAPGNVTLEAGEAGLAKRSVVVVSQLVTLDKTQVGGYIGSLSGSRVRQILAGLHLLTEPREAEDREDAQ